MNKVWLSPETSDATRMIQLTKVLMRKNLAVVNMFFHSTSLIAGFSHFVKTKEDESRFMKCMREYFTFTTEAGLKPVTLSEFGYIIRGTNVL